MGFTLSIPMILLASFLLSAACGPAKTGTYPSYAQVIAKYAPPGDYAAARLTDPSTYPDGRYCHYCPRVWYTDHWVYFYHGNWIYWYGSYWYYYPYFYVYYVDGVAHVYSGPVKSITKGQKTSSDSSTSSGATAPQQSRPASRPAPRPSSGRHEPRSGTRSDNPPKSRQSSPGRGKRR